MQKKYLALIIALIIVLTTTIPAIASSPSPSPSPTAKPTLSPVDTTEIVNENVKKRLQDSLKIKETTPSSGAKGFIGIVKDVIKDTVVIEDKDGKKDIKLDDNTSILRTPGNIAIKVENIRIDDYIIAIGYPGEADVLIGKRLIVSVNPIKAPDKKSDIGTITKIGKSSITLKLSDKDQVIDITAKTIYKSTVGTIEFTDLSVGDTIIYTAIADEDNLTATILMRTGTASVDE